jgi:hypothetical protein
LILHMQECVCIFFTFFITSCLFSVSYFHHRAIGAPSYHMQHNPTLLSNFQHRHSTPPKFLIEGYCGRSMKLPFTFVYSRVSESIGYIFTRLCNFMTWCSFNYWSCLTIQCSIYLLQIENIETHNRSNSPKKTYIISTSLYSSVLFNESLIS